MSDTIVHTGRAQLQLLGGFGLNRADGLRVDIPSRRGRALLAYLHLARDQSANRERLCGLLWSDRGDAQARASLRQCLFELRESLATAGLDLLEVSRDTIALRSEAVSSDMAELEQALRERDCDRVAASLGALGSLRLLEDTDLSGLFQDWLDQARTHYDQSLAGGVRGLLASLVADQRWPEARVIADAFLQRDPYDETVVAAAIRADLATGGTASAHRRFQALKDDLAREFGVPPGPIVSEAIASAPGPRTAAPAAIEVERQAPMLAVLAFDNLSGDQEMDFFSDGVSDEILQTVSRASNLRVIARSSSFQFRGPAKVPHRVAAETKATHLLDGSVRRSGSRVRITAQLVECASQSTLWSDRFDRELADVFALQDEIAEAVASALEAAFAPSGPAGPVDPIAYELYLRARALEVEQKAGAVRIQLLEQVVARAPTFAAAWAALCQARVAQARHGPRPKPFAILKQEVLHAAETALELDPRSGPAYASLSRLQPWGCYAEREALLRRAVSVAPEDAETLALMGAFCNHLGRISEALTYLRKAYELDPLYPLTADIYGAVLAAAGSPEAPALYESWRRRWPEHLTFALGPMNLAMVQRDWARFDELLPDALSRNPDDPYLAATVKIAQAVRTDDPALRPRIVRSLQRSLGETGTVPLHTLATASALGMTVEAFSAIEQASYAFMFQEDGMEPASVYNPGIIFDPQYCGAIMQDTRFVGLCAKLGLCDYWAETDRWPDCAAPIGAHYDFKAESLRLAGSA
ncbi:MAG TPA: BTAD domain-containing putative transcriptional regulator [Caulobacteraceae bacterium]|nr:BTAD domain-containing putative transcriptional regulator [Caulobacteraceae bacterium]